MTEPGDLEPVPLAAIDEWLGRPVGEEAWHTAIDGRGKEFFGLLLESFGVDTDFLRDADG